MTSPIQPLSISEKAFARTFVRDFSSPYAIQQPEGRRADWRTKYKPVSDPLIHAHLAQEYWLGVKAPWYPIYFNLDIDRPTKKTLETISSRLDAFGISEHQRALMTTPSHAKHGNFRVYLKLEYSDRLPTWKLGYDALSGAFGDVCEVYPQKRRKDRLPCGRSQDLISEDGQILTNLTWQDELHYLQKLDPVPIEQLPRQVQLEFPEFSPHSGDSPKAWKPRGEAAELKQNGLQQHSTRHEAQFVLLNDLWRSNWMPGDAAAYVKNWIRRKHNGYSKSAAQGRWKDIYAEIDRQIKSIWSRPQTLLPDTPHSLNLSIVKADLELAAEIFRGDAVRQKQFINLTAYIRPRQHHEWVYIPAWVWADKVASRDTYKKFISELEGKGILQSNNSYRVGQYSKRFKLELTKTSEQPISFDGRNTTDFYEALWQGFGSVKDISDATGLNRMTVWRKYQQE
jgi:hypothetical protein